METSFPGFLDYSVRAKTGLVEVGKRGDTPCLGGACISHMPREPSQGGETTETDGTQETSTSDT